MKKTTILLLIVFSSIAVASGGSEHSNEIPIKFILIQLVYFLIFITGLFFLLRNKVQEFFASRHVNYNKALDTVRMMRAQAEEKHQEIREKMSHIETGSEESLKRAKQEAEELRKRIIEEAKTLSIQLKEDAERATKVEIEKAISKLREELLAEAIKLASAEMSKNVKLEDQTRLNKEFVNNIRTTPQ